jgi:hypothetical protein
VYLCAPDHFPARESVGPNEQWTLDLAFEGLRHGLSLTSKEKGELPVLTTCRSLVEKAYADYREGRMRDGFLTLEEMERLLMKLPSQ